MTTNPRVELLDAIAKAERYEMDLVRIDLALARRLMVALNPPQTPQQQADAILKDVTP